MPNRRAGNRRSLLSIMRRRARRGQKLVSGNARSGRRIPRVPAAPPSRPRYGRATLRLCHHTARESCRRARAASSRPTMPVAGDPIETPQDDLLVLPERGVDRLHRGRIVPGRVRGPRGVETGLQHEPQSGDDPARATTFSPVATAWLERKRPAYVAPNRCSTRTTRGRPRVAPRCPGARGSPRSGASTSRCTPWSRRPRPAPERGPGRGRRRRDRRGRASGRASAGRLLRAGSWVDVARGRGTLRAGRTASQTSPFTALGCGVPIAPSRPASAGALPPQVRPCPGSRSPADAQT